MNRCAHLEIRLLLTSAFCLLALGATGCSDDKSGNDESEPVLMAVPFDDQLEAGKWVLCWDQHDQGGLLVTSGDYQAKIMTGEYTKLLSFVITATAPRIPSLSCGSPSAPNLPEEYAAGITSPEYAPGDTVNVIVELPVADSVVMEILRR